MKTFMMSVMLQVEVQAHTQEDALSAVNDCFGEGETCGMNVVESEVVEIDELY